MSCCDRDLVWYSSDGRQPSLLFAATTLELQAAACNISSLGQYSVMLLQVTNSRLKWWASCTSLRLQLTMHITGTLSPRMRSLMKSVFCLPLLVLAMLWMLYTGKPYMFQLLSSGMQTSASADFLPLPLSVLLSVCQNCKRSVC